MLCMAKSWGGLLASGLLVSTASFAQSAPSVPPASTPPTSTAAATALPAGIGFTSPHASAALVPSSPEAWGGARTGKEATLSDRVVGYTIEATLDAPKHAVDAKEKLTWRNRSDQPVSAIYVHLYLNAFESSGSTFMTERKVMTAQGHARGVGTIEKGDWGYIDLKNVAQGGTELKWSFVHPDDGPATDHTVARIDLAQPVPAGGTLDLDIDFHSQLPKVIERTGHVGDFNMVGQWFPKIGVMELAGERGATAPRWNVHEFHFSSEFYADFGSYDVSVTAPKDYVVAAVGEQQGEPVAKGNDLTWRFKQDDVHDFAFMAAPGFKTIDGEWDHPGSPHVKVKVVYPPEFEASAQPALKATVDSLTYFSDTLGAYPYRTVTAVIPPFNADEAGGMEYPTFFTAEGYDKVEPGTGNVFELDFVTIHEFGHGYFYGLLATNEFEEPMLDEGLNEYWDQRMLRARKQLFIIGNPLMKWWGITNQVSGFDVERITAGLSSPPDPLGQNAWDRFSSGSYGTVYSRTATAMHDLEERLGHDAMEKAFKAYYARWHFRHPSAADLRQSLIESTGDADTVNTIFNQYVYGTGFIDDRVVRVSSSEVLPLVGLELKDGKRVEVTEEENTKRIADARKAWKDSHADAKDDEGPYPWHSTVTVARDGNPAPQVLEVTFADGVKQRVAWNDERRWARFEFERPVKVVSAELDPDHKFNLDTNKINDSYTTKTSGAAARRWTSDIGAVLQGIYAMLVTL